MLIHALHILTYIYNLDTNLIITEYFYVYTYIYIATIENLQDSLTVNEPPTLPEVTNGSTIGEEDRTSFNEGSYIYMHICMHAYTLYIG